jgi:RNA polymerase sigma factor (sigma-70 family)
VREVLAGARPHIVAVSSSGTAIIRHLTGGPGESDDGDDLLSACLPIVRRVVDFVCRRNHLPESEAEDFASFVTLTLLADDSAKLRQFGGRSSIQTYLSVVIDRLFLDYRRSRWGKWRPSAHAVRLGPAATVIEQLLARDGHSPDEAYELVTTNHRITMSRPEFDAIVALLPPRQPRRFHSEDVLVDIPATSARPDELLLELEAGRREQSVSTALQQAMESLAPEDRLVLTMRFFDGHSVADIASALGLEQKALYRRIARLLRDLRLRLEADGVDANLVAGVFGPADARRVTGTVLARPSIQRGTGQ